MSSPVAQRWPLAYRPLGLRGLFVQIAVLAAAETLLLLSYRGHQASFHWATHFLVGLSVAALVNLVWLALKGAPARGQLLSVLGWHLMAMFPDLLFAVGVPHDAWMDVFLAHISSHDVPGGAYTWLFVALALSALYAVFLAGWLSARHVEAAAGMAPGLGLGGRALVHPQADPRETMLARTCYGPEGPPDVVLLHGLGASRAVWVEVATELEQDGHSVVVPDLLGFGASRTIGTEFRLADHVDAVRRLLLDCAADAPVIVGHSLGCAVATVLAGSAPATTRGLVLVSPPVFRDGVEARARLGSRGWLARQVLNRSPVASVTCGAMCLMRAPVASAVGRLAPGLPEQVARDSVQHTWPAYRDALMLLLEENPLPAAIVTPFRPTTVVVGDEDTETPARDVLDWPHDKVEVIVVPGGDHLLPLRHPRAVARAVSQALLG